MITNCLTSIFFPNPGKADPSGKDLFSNLGNARRAYTLGLFPRPTTLSWALIRARPLLVTN